MLESVLYFCTLDVGFLSPDTNTLKKRRLQKFKISFLCFWFVSADQDGLLRFSAGWRSSHTEGRNRRFLPAAWEKSAAVFCSAQPLQDGAEAVWWSLHAGVLPQLWVWCFGASNNTNSVLVAQKDGLGCSNDKNVTVCTDQTICCPEISTF